MKSIAGYDVRNYVQRVIQGVSCFKPIEYCISNAMQDSNTALEATALVMHDANTFFYVVLLFLVALQISDLRS